MGFLYSRKLALDGNSYRISIPKWLGQAWTDEGVKLCNIEYLAHEDKIVVTPIRPGKGKK